MTLIEKYTSKPLFAVIALTAALLLTMGLYPSIGNAAEEAKAQKNVKSPDDVICKRQKISGSHMKQRICFTRAEWDEIRRQSQANAASAMRGGASISPQ